MKVFYQWIPGAYSHQVATEIVYKLSLSEENVQWLFSFKDIFESIKSANNLGILPIENSYAGVVHQSLYLMKRYNFKIIGEYYLPIQHCLAAKNTDLNKIKKVYSHPQALMQCEKFLQKYWLRPIPYSDTARAAKYIADEGQIDEAAICSTYAAKLYWLNILKNNIADQEWNTTRFLVIKDISNDFEFSDIKKYKWSLLFKVKDQPGILFKSLWAFATRFINLTKIESIPTQEKKFEYMFWIDYILPENEKILQDVFEELKCFTTEVIDLGRYGKI